MLRCEHRDQIELLAAGVDECMRHSSRHLCNVRRLDREGLVTDPVLGAPLEQDVCFFGVVHMQSGPAAGMGFGNEDRERLEAVLVTGHAVSELARDTEVMLELVKMENKVGWIVRFLGRVCEIFVG